jgi:hypothetical protein
MKGPLDLKVQINRQYAAHDTARQSWVPHWKELQENMLPRKGRFLMQPNQQSRGDKRNQKLLDGTPARAIRISRSGCMSGITSPARPWFRLMLSTDLGRASYRVRLWLEEVERRMRVVFSRSNFYNVLANVYEELLVFGTAGLIIDEDFEDVIRCYPLTIGEYMVGLDHRLAPNQLYRKIPMTVSAMVERFRFENCSLATQLAYNTGNLNQEVEVLHVIEPNLKKVPGYWGQLNKPYRSVYSEAGALDDEFLEIKGYHGKPFMAPRWDVTSNDPYGRSPGMDALPDVRSLHHAQKRKAQAIDKMTNPPMKAPPNLANNPIRTTPGDTTFVSENQGKFEPAYQVDATAVRELREDVREMRENVMQAFYADVFLMISQLDDVRTATEIVERKEEKLLMLGPMLDRFADELLDPAIDRVFDIMMRKGLLPPAPEELNNEFLQIEYISILAQAQRAIGLSGIERSVSFIGNLAGVRPDALDKLNVDETIDAYTDGIGVSSKIIVSTEDAQANRQARAQKQAQMEQGAQALQAVEGAKLLSETQVGAGQNALQRMLGQ